MSFFRGHGNCTWKWHFFSQNGRGMGEISPTHNVWYLRKQITFPKPRRPGLPISLSSGYTDSTCKVKWQSDKGDCDESAARSFQASLSSVLENNCINTEKVLMWNCGGAEVKNHYWNFSSLLPIMKGVTKDPKSRKVLEWHIFFRGMESLTDAGYKGEKLSAETYFNHKLRFFLKIYLYILETYRTEERLELICWWPVPHVLRLQGFLSPY